MPCLLRKAFFLNFQLAEVSYNFRRKLEKLHFQRISYKNCLLDLTMAKDEKSKFHGSHC